MTRARAASGNTGPSFFPVKSMLGEQLNELHITSRGVMGDRAWALRELDNQRIASAKKFVGLLKFHAKYEGEPGDGKLPPVKITLPDGREIRAQAAERMVSPDYFAALGMRQPGHVRPREQRA